jgi:acetyl-CoA decarbonylase/synthase, CODH/ACS complex subunit gamma
MALTGLTIQKYLPKTNCKECGSNTCLAFAMKLAAKKASLAECPYASEEAKALLGAAGEPPVKAVSLGQDGHLKLGGETVFYRHEKTFVNQTAIAINIDDADPDDVVANHLEQIRSYQLERVGETLRIDLVAVSYTGNDPKRYLEVVRQACEVTGLPLVLFCDDTETLCLAAEAVSGSGSLLASADESNLEPLQAAATLHQHALALTAPDLDGLIRLTTRLKSDGFDHMILHFRTHSLAEQFQTNAIARRAALKNGLKALGYPTLRRIPAGNLLDTTVAAVTEITKFGAILVLPEFDPAQLATLMTLRMNIYTDPQKPIQVEPNIYPIGEPGRNAPVFVTTNFSLTFFIVSGEIENSGLSAWLVVPECDGMSVLTSWAAGKFSGESIARFVKESGLEERIDTRQIIIPGYVAQISGELEENLPGWKAVVGPQESADLESFITNVMH